MSTRRYPLHDGRHLEIIDPVFSGRAYFYVDGEYLGERTIDELRRSHRITLPDGGTLLIHVVKAMPFFRLFDVRHNGAAVRGSGSDPRWARRTAIEILILSAASDLVFMLPVEPVDYIKPVFVVVALLLAVGIWRDFDDAPSFARKFMFIRCLIGAVHFGGGNDPMSLDFNVIAFALYIWMRHLTNVTDYTPEIHEPSLQKMPQVTLG